MSSEGSHRSGRYQAAGDSCKCPQAAESSKEAGMSQDSKMEAKLVPSHQVFQFVPGDHRVRDAIPASSLRSPRSTNLQVLYQAFANAPTIFRNTFSLFSVSSKGLHIS
jgi:hypothetical protein